jgi:hypothetical protein
MKVTEAKKGLNFATDLRLFARSKAPDAYAEAIVQKAATQLQLHYGESDRLKSAKILAYMKNTESVSVRDIMDKFKWVQPVVSKLVAEMLKDELIIEFKQPTIVGLGGRGGRPATRYRLP